VAAEYHRTVLPPVPGAAVRVTAPDPDREALFPTGKEGITMVAVTGIRGEVLSQVVDELYELM
jgi:hypothetical protein